MKEKSLSQMKESGVQCTSGGLSFRKQQAQLIWKGGKLENTGAVMMWWWKRGNSILIMSFFQ